MLCIRKILLLWTLPFFMLACSEHENPTKDTNGSQTSLKGEPSENVEQNVEKLLSQLTLDEKISLVHADGTFHVAAVERLGIPELWMSDGPHGVRHQMERYTFNSLEADDDFSTYLPPTTMVAASWNPELAALHGDVLGAEARHREKDIILGPGVNLARLPINGRNFEYMGEDPFLASELAVETIKAIQQHDVAATVKHLALNTQELNRSHVDSAPDERTLREVYLPIFEASVKEGDVYAVMGAYNAFRGTNSNQSKHLIDILKKEWGFDGVLLTDWHVDINTYDAAMHGLDIEMGTSVTNYDDYFFAGPLKQMVLDGKIPEAVLDDKVRRVLRLQLRVGMLDKERSKGERNTPKHQKAAYKIAAEGVVLLKNDDKLLPLNTEKVKNILVLGPNADKKHAFGGGSSQVKALYEITPLQGIKEKLGDKVNLEYLQVRSNGVHPMEGEYVLTRHWTGTPAWNLTRYSDPARQTKMYERNVPDSAYQTMDDSTEEFISMKADIQPLVSGEHILKASVEGEFTLLVNNEEVLTGNTDSEKVLTKKMDFNKDKKYTFEVRYSGSKQFTFGWEAPGASFTPESEYLAAAKKADVVLYFGGLSHNEDRESIDRVNMKMPYGQDALIAKLLAANDKTVVFLTAGSPVEMPWLEQASTLVWGWYGGMEGGRAYADILFGDVNPSGKLPMTLPKKLSDSAAFALNDYNETITRYPEGVYIGYRWFEQQNIEPLFPFGYGLSYTSFAYDNIRLSSESISGDETITVKASVKNTGDKAGAEIVQLYLGDIEASVARPVKELKGFQKVFLAPGESKDIEITLEKRDLSFWDVKSNNWLAEPGEFKVMLGSSVEDIHLSKGFTYTAKEELVSN